MICPINEKICDTLTQKYSFLKSISLKCSEKGDTVYMEPKITLGTTPTPSKFYDLKYDVYSMVHEATNKKPQLRMGWIIESEKNSRSY